MDDFNQILMKLELCAVFTTGNVGVFLHQGEEKWVQ